MLPIESILQFPNPNTPDLGCFVRRKHEFRTDPDVDFQNVHVEFNPSIDFNPPTIRHIFGSCAAKQPSFRDAWFI